MCYTCPEKVLEIVKEVLYMKLKLILTIAILLITVNGLEVFANNNYSEKFIKNLVSCTPYKEESSFDFFGAKITPVTVVKGRVNGKCVYESYMKEAPENKYICAFTSAQLKEFDAASKKDQTKQETYHNAENGSSYTSDPVSVLFTKFLNDPGTCKLPGNN